MCGFCPHFISKLGQLQSKLAVEHVLPTELHVMIVFIISILINVIPKYVHIV